MSKDAGSANLLPVSNLLSRDPDNVLGKRVGAAEYLRLHVRARAVFARAKPLRRVQAPPVPIDACARFVSRVGLENRSVQGVGAQKLVKCAVVQKLVVRRTNCEAPRVRHSLKKVGSLLPEFGLQPLHFRAELALIHQHRGVHTTNHLALLDRFCGKDTEFESGRTTRDVSHL